MLADELQRDRQFRRRRGCLAAGGGLLTDYGTLSLTSVTVSGNKAASYGGGLCSEKGTVTLNGCTVSGNSAAKAAGLFSNGAGGSMILTNSTVSGNTASDLGGGLLG